MDLSQCWCFHHYKFSSSTFWSRLIQLNCSMHTHTNKAGLEGGSLWWAPMGPSIELTFIIHMSLASQSVTIHNVEECTAKLERRREGGRSLMPQKLKRRTNQPTLHPTIDVLNCSLFSSIVYLSLGAFALRFHFEIGNERKSYLVKY